MERIKRAIIKFLDWKYFFYLMFFIIFIGFIGAILLQNSSFLFLPYILLFIALGGFTLYVVYYFQVAWKIIIKK